MRCAKGIVEEGDTMTVLLNRCGRPSTIFYSEKKKSPAAAWMHLHKRIRYKFAQWIYERGPNDFCYRVEIQKNKITKIAVEEYGISQ